MTTQWFIWDLGIGTQLLWTTILIDSCELLEGNKSRGERICNIPFSIWSRQMVFDHGIFHGNFSWCFPMVFAFIFAEK